MHGTELNSLGVGECQERASRLFVGKKLEHRKIVAYLRTQLEARAGTQMHKPCRESRLWPTSKTHTENRMVWSLDSRVGTSLLSPRF